MLSLLSWDEFQEIAGGSWRLFMLLLPLVVGDSSKRKEITEAIRANLLQMPLEFKEADISIITDYLVSHLIFEDDEDCMFETDPELGMVCKRNHSRRKKDSPSNTSEEIIRINKLIKMAEGGF